MGAPGGLFEASKFTKNDQLTSSELQRMQDQLQRLTRVPNVPGLTTSWGFYPDQVQSSESVSVQFVLLDDALFPGTYDLPGEAKGKLMAPSGNKKMAPTSEVVDVLNYSTSIYAPIGGIAICQPTSLGLVAIGSAS